MKEILLTKGQKAMVDDEDYDAVIQRHWHARPSLNTFYATRKIYVNKKYKNIHLHQFVLKTDQKVDHIDRNGLNNQKSNLRICTHSQNMANAKKRKNTKSKYKGLTWDKYRNSWQVSCSLEGKRLRVSRCKDEVEAALIYNVVASFAHREFANLNKL